MLLLAWLLGIPRLAGEVGALAAIGAYVLAVGAQPSVVRAGVAGALDLARVDLCPRARSLVVSPGRRARAARLEPVQPPRRRLPALVRGGRGDLHARAASHAAARGLSAAAASSRAWSPSRPPVASRRRRSCSSSSGRCRPTRCSATRLRRPWSRHCSGSDCSPPSSIPLLPDVAALRQPRSTAGLPRTCRVRAAGRRPAVRAARRAADARRCRGDRLRVGGAASERQRDVPRRRIVLAVVALAGFAGWHMLPHASPPPPPNGLADHVSRRRPGRRDAGPGTGGSSARRRRAARGPRGRAAATARRPRAFRGRADTSGTRPRRRRRRSARSDASASRARSADRGDRPGRARGHRGRARATRPHRHGAARGGVSDRQAADPRALAGRAGIAERQPERRCDRPARLVRADRRAASPPTRSRTSCCRFGFRPVEILKVSHHGSADAGLPALLEDLRPRIAVISVGAGNTYGHPTPETLAALACVARAGRLPNGRGRRRDGRVGRAAHHRRHGALGWGRGRCLKPVYLITGGDRPKIQRAVERLRAAFRRRGHRALLGRGDERRRGRRFVQRARAVRGDGPARARDARSTATGTATTAWSAGGRRLTSRRSSTT